MLSVKGNPNATRWSMERGYFFNKYIGFNTYPYRVPSSGIKVGFFAELRLFQKDLDYICRGPTQGFKVTLHNPDELPQVSKHFVRVPLDQEVLVSVQPQMITTSDGLRNYNPIRRGCYFESERTLKFFKSYSQRNCELECVAEATLRKCGCVKFSMPSN